MTTEYTNEIWKPAANLAGIEVSNLGRIRGNKRPITISTSGYEAFTHGGAQHLVHRLVCLTFSGPAPAGKNRVLHWNDQKLDNRAENLRWGDAKDNAEDAKRNGIKVGAHAWRCKTCQSPQEPFSA